MAEEVERQKKQHADCKQGMKTANWLLTFILFSSNM